MNKFLFLPLAVVVGIVVATPVLAGSEEQINAQVTTELLSVSLSDNSIDYGIVPTGGNTSNPSQQITATNNGNITEDFQVLGADATMQGNPTKIWTLANDSGTDEYEHWLSAVSSPSFPSDYLQMTKNYQEFADSVAVSGTSNFKTVLVSPNTSTGFGTYETQVTIMAVKHN